MSASTIALAVGYAAAVPFTLWLPGFLRVWRRREPVLFALSEGGAVLVAAGWALRGGLVGAVVNAAWALGYGAAYAREGRRRALGSLGG